MIQQARHAFLLANILWRQWRNRQKLTSAIWLQNTAARLADLLDLQITTSGELPASGLIVSNHLGYLDIIALATLQPCRFVAKADVAEWPVFGAFAKQGGTIFVNRRQRADVVAANSRLSKALAEPLCTVIFPEGTSTDGQTVLPFHASLLEPALAAGCAVTPLAISYQMHGADAGQCMAYHSEMTLLPHLWKLLGQRKMRIHLAFGETRRLFQSRKIEATILREEIVDLLKKKLSKQ